MTKFRYWSSTIGSGFGAATGGTLAISATSAALLLAVVGGSIAGVVGGALGGKVMDRLRETRRVPGLQAGLSRNELELERVRILERRLLESRSAVIEDVLPGERENALAMLETKLDVRRREREVLMVQMWQVAFERWVNCLEPLLVNLESLSWEEIDHRRLVVDQFFEMGRASVERWKGELDEELELGMGFILHVETVLASVIELRSTLALRKGTFADPAASRIVAATSSVGSGAFELSAVRERVAAARDEISTEIESELERLQAENDVERLLAAP